LLGALVTDRFHLPMAVFTLASLVIKCMFYIDMRHSIIRIVFDYLGLLNRLNGHKIRSDLTFNHWQKPALGQRGLPLVDIFVF